MARHPQHPGLAQYARHVNPAFLELLGILRYGRVFTRARDVWVWDHEGRQYLDALACYGAANIGHNHPRLVEHLRAHLLGEHLNLVHAGPSMHEAELAARLVELAGRDFDVAIIGSSGAQAVEEGMKLARAYTGRAGFLYCEGSYHGASLGTLSIMGDARMRRSFEPLLGHCRAVPFGDVQALEQALGARDVAAFVLDPGLSEAGAMVPPDGYLRAAKDLCARHGTLLLLDEVQTGLGRTGALFAFEHDSVAPDILALAKSLSGGLVPVGATLTRADIAAASCGKSDNFDVHFSTFGGNALACAAALETLRIIEDEDLVEHSRARGVEIRAELQSRLGGHPLVRDVRGRGLFIAVELGPRREDWRSKLRPALLERASSTIFGQWAALELLERGVICQPATHQWNVLKLMPPLTLTREHAHLLVDAVAGVLDEYRSVTRIMRDLGKRVGRQFLAGWRF